jgi:hypothetical protein
MMKYEIILTLQKFQHMLRNAKKRITISTLYIGVEQQELVGKLEISQGSFSSGINA